LLQSAQKVRRSDDLVFARKTYVVSQNQPTVVAHRLKNFLDFHDETWHCQFGLLQSPGKTRTDVEDRRGKFDVAKVTRADLDVLLAGCARVHAVDGAELGVVQALLTRLRVGLVHGLGVDDVDDAHGLDLLGGEQPELDLLDGAERTFRLHGCAGRHGCGGCGVSRVRGSRETLLAVVAGG
jgi:hypothetical protein